MSILLHFRKKRVTLPGDDPTQALFSSAKELPLSKSNSQSSNLAIKNNPTAQSISASTHYPPKVDPAYAVPQRIEYTKQDLKAALVEKYSEPQYQNVPNDLLLKRKNSVDANTMTNWMQNGIPVSD